jgi:probable HAF family extracellular repeat protein
MGWRGTSYTFQLWFDAVYFLYSRIFTMTETMNTTLRYQAIDVGALSPNANNVRGAAINDRGQISGRSETGETQVVGDRTFTLNQGFIWEKGEIQALPLTGMKMGGETDGQTVTMPGAGGFVQAMNNRGVVVGAADEVLGKATDRGTYWQRNQARDYEFTIYDFGGIESYFFDINRHNQIAGRNIYGPGSTADAPNRSKPIYWEDGVVQDLPTLGGDTGTTRGINDQGQLVGQIDSDGLNDKTMNTAVLWEKNAEGGYELINLGTFGAEQSIARDINESGQIIGWATTGSGTTAEDSLFLIDNGVHTTLGNLGGKRGETADINEFGQIVGYSQTVDGKDRAFLWDEGQMYDLNQLVGGKLDWHGYAVTLTRATGINNAGDIVSYGTYTYLDVAGQEQTGTRTFLLSADYLPIA